MMYPVFGDAPALKMLDWMIGNQEFDHPLKEIADGAEIAISVAKRNFEPLIRHNVVKITRTIGKGNEDMYVLDLQNRCTKAIVDFDKRITQCCKSEEEAPPAPIEILPPEI